MQARCMCIAGEVYVHCQCTRAHGSDQARPLAGRAVAGRAHGSHVRERCEGGGRKACAQVLSVRVHRCSLRVTEALRNHLSFQKLFLQEFIVVFTTLNCAVCCALRPLWCLSTRICGYAEPTHTHVRSLCMLSLSLARSRSRTLSPSLCLSACCFGLPGTACYS